MEHCKKLVLVPHETLSRLHDKPVSRTESDVLGELDTEMHKILLQKAEDSEKWKLYQQTLQRYLHFVNEQRKPLELTLPTTYDPRKSENTEDQQKLLNQLNTVTPKKFQQHATTLFNALAQDKTFVSWDSTGQLRIDGTLLPQSHVVELISDAVRTRKTAQASGWKAFASILRRINVPLNLISNTKYKEFIHSQRGMGHRERTKRRNVQFGRIVPHHKLLNSESTQPNRSQIRWSPWSK